MLVSLLACALALGAIGQAGCGAGASTATRAHAASAYLTGIGNENPKMFKQPAVRAAAHEDRPLRRPLRRRRAPLLAGSGDHVHHGRGSRSTSRCSSPSTTRNTRPTKLPSVASYQRDVQKFVKLFPNVRQYESWDESNRGNVTSASSRARRRSAAAKYYQALLRVCKGCTVIGLDVLDSAVSTPTLRYISEFKREISHLETVMPKIWGLHNYSDVNRLESWRTRDIVQSARRPGVADRDRRAREIRRRASRTSAAPGLTRAAKVLKYMFALAGALPQIKRLYVYDWTGGTNSTRFDAGPDERPRTAARRLRGRVPPAARGQMQRARPSRTDHPLSAGCVCGPVAAPRAGARAPAAGCASAASRQAPARRRATAVGASVSSG